MPSGKLLANVAFVLLGLVGLISIVDLGFGPIVICPKCAGWLNILIGIIFIAVAAGAYLANRKTVAKG